MLSYKLDGLDRIVNKCAPALIVKPLRKFFERSAITVQGKAREGAPVDTGHLRNMVVYEVDGTAVPRFAKVGFLNASQGSPLWFKARAMEFGTGSQGDSAVSHKASHRPRGAALDVWASRHGWASGFAVAKAIARRGGLKPRPFLRPALKESLGAIRGFLNQLGDEIRLAWEKK